MDKREWMLQAALAWIANPASLGTSGVVKNLSDMYDAIVAASPEIADNGWQENTGSVEVRFRDGETEVGRVDHFSWDIDDVADDLVAWRPFRA